MEVSFDGLRKNIASSQQDLYKAIQDLDDADVMQDFVGPIQDIKDDMDKHTSMLWGLMCCYDDKVDGDVNDLVDKVDMKKFCEDEDA